MPTTLPVGTTAVAVDESGEFQLYLPKVDPDQDLSDGALLLVAVMMRSKDPEWVSSMLEWFAEAARDEDAKGDC